MPEGRYLADSIKLVHASAAIRARPEMYVGDVDDPGTLVGLACAPLCLAIDRWTGGPARTVEVELCGDGSIRTHNDGPGIRVVETRPGMLSLESIMTELHACAAMKSDAEHASWCGDERHNHGIAVMNALGAWCRLEVRRDGRLYTQAYERGRPTAPVAQAPDDGPTGTTVTWMPDAEILATPIERRRLEERIASFREYAPCVSVAVI